MRAAVLAFFLTVPAEVQLLRGADYKLEEHSLNSGGRPAQAVTSSSPLYRVSLESIGEPVIGRALSSASFTLQGGFGPAYSPPGEVAGLAILADHQTLTWLHEPSSTGYNVYSSPISSLPGGYGSCAAAQVAGVSWSDPATPLPGSGLFYLVTGVSRLREEGTKGYGSGGAERDNSAPCP